MLKVIRILLFPFSILYGIIVTVRNWLFDLGIKKSTSFELPIISVGNLSVGGTGKTPMIEYLIRLFAEKKITVLSRGYKRATQGFVLADETTTVTDIGDEPFQFFSKFKNISVAVDEKRVHGVEEILKQKPTTELVLLDDSFQHRHIKPGLQILLTSYDKLFYKDFILPTGDLRELWWGKNRADIIVVTKCPETISGAERHKITQRIHKKKPVFFTTIAYADTVYSLTDSRMVDELINTEIVLVTGIAKSKPLVIFLESKCQQIHHLEYSDHHNFTAQEVKDIQAKFDVISSENKILLTTEKDFMRLQNEFSDLYYLPIQVKFIGTQMTKQHIQDCIEL